ncbi:MAG TPA: glycosyltransferase family 2 protein [Acidobacteriota bacterium]
MQPDTNLSVVIPCFNERENLRPLLAEIHKGLDPLGYSWEVIITDDGSIDGSWEEMQAIAAEDWHLRVQRLKRNSGETAASWAGMHAARGDLIITMDADLQNDPREIPKFLEALRDCDLVCGTRTRLRATGDSAVKILYSGMTNWVRRRLLNDGISDSGCTFRAFRRECLRGLQPFRGMHRFLPALFKLQGYRVREIPVRNRCRSYGRSKYGIWNRLLPSFLDLLAVRWMKSRWIRIELEEGSLSVAARFGHSSTTMG